MCRDQEKKGAFVAWVAAETRKEKKIIKGPFGGNWGLSERFDVFRL